MLDLRATIPVLVVLSAVYVLFGETPLVAGIFYGIKPAVTAIVVHAAYRIGSRVLRHGVLWAIAAAAFITPAQLGGSSRRPRC